MGAKRAGLVVVVALLPITGTLSVLPDFPLSDGEIQTRARYYTEAGKYRGGYPKYENAFQIYECTEFDSDIASATTDGNATTTITDGGESNATVCMAWTSNEGDSETYEIGKCSCQAVATNFEYCESWTCSQVGVESTRCTCETEDDDSGNFCSSWTCVETDSDGTQEFGEYQCVTASSSIPSEFCTAWTGVIEGSGEVEVAACQCVEQWDGDGVCSYWECKERALEKCSHANKGWCNIGVSIGVGGFFGSLGAMLVGFHLFSMALDDPEWIVIVPVGFFWMAAWSAGVVVWGGQDGAVFAAIWWVFIMALGLICRFVLRYRDRVREGRIQSDAPIPNRNPSCVREYDLKAALRCITCPWLAKTSPTWKNSDWEMPVKN